MVCINAATLTRPYHRASSLSLPYPARPTNAMLTIIDIMRETVFDSCPAIKHEIQSIGFVSVLIVFSTSPELRIVEHDTVSAPSGSLE